MCSVLVHEVLAMPKHSSTLRATLKEKQFSIQKQKWSYFAKFSRKWVADSIWNLQIAKKQETEWNHLQLPINWYVQHQQKPRLSCRKWVGLVRFSISSNEFSSSSKQMRVVTDVEKLSVGADTFAKTAKSTKKQMLCVVKHASVDYEDRVCIMTICCMNVWIGKWCYTSRFNGRLIREIRVESNFD